MRHIRIHNLCAASKWEHSRATVHRLIPAKHVICDVFPRFVGCIKLDSCPRSLKQTKKEY